MAPRLIHEIIPVGLLQCNCSILGDAETRDAIVIDPGDEPGRIEEILGAHKLSVRAIVSTHTHIDHVGGLAALHRATGAPVLIHEADLELYRHLDVQAQFLGVPTPASTPIQDFVKEGDTLRWGGFQADILHTPGHTPGSISLVIGAQSPQIISASAQIQIPAERAGKLRAKSAGPSGSGDSRLVIAGDTLFEGSIGRTDLWGGSFPQLIESIRAKLLTLPDSMTVFPGHGATTTIGAEREHNPFLR
ncbi:MAG: MBL fold metallo-hydrolase [Candidatus Acidiferrales bacterium]